MQYKVIAECVDGRTGRRYLPGELFDPAPDAEQATRLIGARAIVEDMGDGLNRMFVALADDADGRGMKLVDIGAYRFIGVAIGLTAPSSAEDYRWRAIEVDPSETGAEIETESDGLDEMTVPLLKELAAKEGATVEPAARKGDIIDAIRLKRADAPAAPIDDGLDALDDAGLAARAAELGVALAPGLDRPGIVAAIRTAPKAA